MEPGESEGAIVNRIVLGDNLKVLAKLPPASAELIYDTQALLDIRMRFMPFQDAAFSFEVLRENKEGLVKNVQDV